MNLNSNFAYQRISLNNRVPVNSVIYIYILKNLCRYTPEPLRPQPQRVGAMGLNTRCLPDGGGGGAPRKPS
jgi:hypothetical protein